MTQTTPTYSGPTPWSKTTIVLQVSTANDGRWGADTTDDQAILVANHYMELAAEYAAQEFPGASLQFCTTTNPDPLSYAIDEDSDSYYEADDPNGPVYAITDYLSRHWTEEPLWQRDFDAAAYLERNPQ